jgi:glucose-1-phosphate cytidylyltransferase
MVEIGGRPILWHIMNIFAAHNVTEFIIALGYRGEIIKDYFLNFYAFNNDMTIDLSGGKVKIHDGNQPKWKVHLIDTGLNANTGGRLKRLAKWIDKDETFMFTYGDGVADVDITALVDFHNSHGAHATVTAVQPPGRFGALEIEGEHVREFEEKPRGDGGWTNGGFFVLSPAVSRYLDGDATVWEQEPMRALARDGQLACYRHHGFWQAMDTLRDRNHLEQLWGAGEAPWRSWT